LLGVVDEFFHAQREDATLGKIECHFVLKQALGSLHAEQIDAHAASSGNSAEG
jgi:hypothetical protein